MLFCDHEARLCRNLKVPSVHGRGGWLERQGELT